MTNHCPYHEISSRTPHLCQMDMSLITSLIGAEPRKLTHIAGGDDSCSYWFDIDKNVKTIGNKEDKD
jgi:predicted ArsR family transcriptional regulator